MVASEGIKIAAFNIQIFGRTKMSKPDVVASLVQIFIIYDIVFVQEIRDSSGQAIVNFLEAINSESDHTFEHIISERLGRTKSKEQYAFIFRPDIVQVEETFQDPDVHDLYEREPYAVKFSSKKTAVPEFVIIGIHVDKDDAVAEINHLKDFHSVVKQHFETENIIIMGDLNAGGSYVSKRALKTLELKTDGFYWLISDDEDTTVAKSTAAYDRFILSGEELYSSLIPGSVHVYRFDEEMNLSFDQAKDVSDHYPIELALQAAGQSDDAAANSAGDTGCCGLTALFHRFTAWSRKKLEL